MHSPRHEHEGVNINSLLVVTVLLVVPYHCCSQFDTMYAAGADWRRFNATQRRVRRDMVHIYGNQKTLIPPRNPFDLTGPMGNSISHIFYFQVPPSLHAWSLVPV